MSSLLNSYESCFAACLINCYNILGVHNSLQLYCFYAMLCYLFRYTQVASVGLLAVQH